MLTLNIFYVCSVMQCFLTNQPKHRLLRQLLWMPVHCLLRPRAHPELHLQPAGYRRGPLHCYQQSPQVRGKRKITSTALKTETERQPFSPRSHFNQIQFGFQTVAALFTLLKINFYIWDFYKVHKQWYIKTLSIERAGILTHSWLTLFKCVSKSTVTFFIPVMRGYFIQ